MQERRNHSRLESDWIADVCHLGQRFSARVTNISLGGVELGTLDTWNPVINQSCQLSMQLAGKQMLVLEMYVCWIHDNRVGMQFKRLSREQKRILNRTLSDLSRELTLAESHFVM